MIDKKLIAKPLRFGVLKATLTSNNYATNIEIFKPSFSDESGYTPAESIEVNGGEDITILRDLCEEVLKHLKEIETKF